MRLFCLFRCSGGALPPGPRPAIFLARLYGETWAQAATLMAQRGAKEKGCGCKSIQLQCPEIIPLRKMFGQELAGSRVESLGDSGNDVAFRPTVG